MIDEKFLTTAFLAGMEWERSKNKLPIREAIAICITRIKEKAAEQKMHPTLGESAASDSESKPAPKRVI